MPILRALQHKESIEVNEPGCQRFETSVIEDNENIGRLYKVCDDKATVRQHMETFYMVAYLEGTTPIIMECKLVRAVRAHG